MNMAIKPLPVEIVFHPSWWNKHTGITFDEDFIMLQHDATSPSPHNQIHGLYGTKGAALFDPIHRAFRPAIISGRRKKTVMR
jgi:hypothetical protein